MNKEELIKKIKLERKGYRIFAWTFGLTGIFSYFISSEFIKLPFDVKNYFYGLIIFYSFLVPIIYYILKYFRSAEKNKIKLFENIILGFAFTALLSFFGILFVNLLSSVFVGITYGILTTIGVTAFYASTLAYFLNFRSENLHIQNIAGLILFAMIGGVSASAIFNTNPQWWMESVSYLGMNTQNANLFMNIGLAMASALLLLLSRYVFEEFNKLEKNKLINHKKLKYAKFIYIYSSITLGLIGIFSYGRSPFSTIVHNLSAYTMFPILVLSMLFMSRFIKDFMKGFKLISIFGGILIILIYILFIIQYTSLAIMEISAILIVTIWAYLFLKNIILLNIIKENKLDIRALTD